MVPRAAVAVVAEQADHAGPHLRHQARLDEHADPLADVRVRREAAADPEVEPGAELGVQDADERDVVDLVLRALLPAPAHGRLELPRQVREGRIADVAALRLQQGRRGVDDLAGVHTGQGTADHHPRGVAARLLRREPDRLELFPDRGHVLDPDPMQLDVLPIRDVGDVTPVVLGAVGHRPELIAGELATGDPDPEHEVLVLELVWLRGRRDAARQSLLALGVETPPAEPAAQVRLVDRAEALLRVLRLDAGADVQAVVVLLHALGGIERLVVAERPLALASLPRCRPGGFRHRSCLPKG